MDKVREALFNIIDARDSSFLDLFAGSGAIGCEAVSRGAKRVVLVERERRAVNLIRANLSKVLRMVDTSPSTEVLEVDAFGLLKRPPEESFDYVFCDPPYALEKAPQVVERLLKKGFVRDGGLLVFEISSRRAGEMPQPDRIRAYGDTSLLFYHWSSPTGAE